MNMPYVNIGCANPALNVNTVTLSTGFNESPRLFHKGALWNVRDTGVYSRALDALALFEGKGGSAKKRRTSIERGFRIVHEDLETRVIHPEFNLVAVFATYDITSPHFWTTVDELCPLPGRGLSPAEFLDIARRSVAGLPFNIAIVRWITGTPGAAQAMQAAKAIPDYDSLGNHLPAFMQIADKWLVNEVEDALRSICISHTPSSKPFDAHRI